MSVLAVGSGTTWPEGVPASGAALALPCCEHAASTMQAPVLRKRHAKRVRRSRFSAAIDVKSKITATMREVTRRRCRTPGGGSRTTGVGNMSTRLLYGPHLQGLPANDRR